MPVTWAAAGAFAGGAVVGSFLNVVIHRVPRGRSIVVPGSACPGCGASIAWYDNVPVLSWLLLGRRCRNCLGRISGRYALVELATAALAVACVLLFGPTGRAATTFVMGAFLIALSAIDLAWWILPSEITAVGALAGVALAWATGAPALLDSLIGAVAGWAFFTAVGYLGSLAFRREAMGAGDPKLLGLIGAFLGWQALLPVVFLASAQASVVGLVSIALRGRAHGGGEVQHEDGWTPDKTALPLGPYLSLGALEWALLDLARFNPLAVLTAAP